VAVRKTNISIDDDLIAEVGAILGTTGITATIDEALRRVLAIEARDRIIERLRTMKGLDLDNSEIMAGASRPHRRRERLNRVVAHWAVRRDSHKQ
jgi:Arc/MetJ family transcription regulator